MFAFVIKFSIDISYLKQEAQLFLR